MRDLNVSFSKNRFYNKWDNLQMTWQELQDLFSASIQTDETAEEYKTLTKEDRTSVKDQGCFFGGCFKDGVRKKENVISRSLITLDADAARETFVSEFEDNFKFAGILHSTHSHTPVTPKFRLIIPLQRDVTPEEYSIIARKLISDLGTEQFDPCSLQAEQMMFIPSRPKDIEPVFVALNNRPMLNPDDLLITQNPPIPVTGEQKIKTPQIIDDFNALYDIEFVLDTFLSDVYERVSDKRYKFIKSESEPGLTILNPRYAYSHHATDPAYGQTFDAFGLVQLHLFGGDFQKTKAWAQQLLQHTEVANTSSTKPKTVEEIKNMLAKNNFGQVLNSLSNCVIVLKNDPNLANIAFNTQAARIEVTGKVPWKHLKNGWNDEDWSGLRVYLDQAYGIYGRSFTGDAVISVATERAFNPIEDYINQLPAWDGICRVDSLFIDYLGAEDTPFVKAATRKGLVAAVARVFNPGVKFDHVPVLIGDQGIGKSTLLKKLGKEWFTDSLTLTDMKSKVASEKIQGFWIIELSELVGIRNADLESVKSFITHESDVFRGAYRQNAETHPRKCVIFGTTNAECGFLRDTTGNRRFWPIFLSGNSPKKPWDLTEDCIDQIWAEAYLYYLSGEKLTLSKTEEEAAFAAQIKATEIDEREGIIQDYLETALPNNWDALSIEERIMFLNSKNRNNASAELHKRQYVSTLEIWCECFEKNKADFKRDDGFKITSVLKRLGWRSVETRKTIKPYGQCRVFEPPKDW